MKLRQRVGIIGALILSGAVCSAAAQADQLEKVKASGELNCAVLTNLAPFGSLNPKTNELEGYDVDFCRAIAKEMGLKATLTNVTLDARIPMLNQGRVDVVVAVMGFNEARTKQIDYSYQYFISNQVIALQAGAPYKKVEELAGKRISTIKGSSTPLLIKEVLPTSEMVSFDNGPTAFTAMMQNKVDAIGMSETMISLFRSKLDNPDVVRVIPPPFSKEIWGIGIKKGEAGMQREVNQALTKIEKSGEAERIFEKWLGASSIYKMKRDFTIGPISGYTYH